MLGEIERQQRPHAVIAEPLPHLGGEQPRQLARMAEPCLLVGGICRALMSGEHGSSTAGVSTIISLPSAAARRDRNGQIALVKRIVADGAAPLYARRRCSTTVHRSFRCSRPAARESRASWSGPGRRPAELERILTIAARTPDHGKLTPWRFVTVADDQRDAFEALLLQALAEQDPDAPTGQASRRSDDFAHYQGQLVVLVSAPVEDHKIPVWEQELSCGAAGMNLLLAAHALGYVAGWVTGWRAYSERVRARLLRARRADRRLHLHRPRRPRARGARAAARSRRSWRPWQPPKP